MIVGISARIAFGSGNGAYDTDVVLDALISAYANDDVLPISSAIPVAGKKLRGKRDTSDRRLMVRYS